MVPLHNCCFGGFAEHFGVPWEKLGKLGQERGWLVDLEPAQSLVREVLWSQLVRCWGGTVESVATSSPCDLSTILHWRTFMRMLAEIPRSSAHKFLEGAWCMEHQGGLPLHG